MTAATGKACIGASVLSRSGGKHTATTVAAVGTHGMGGS